MPSAAKMLNLGCGGRFHPDWTNVDFHSAGAGVIAHDLTLGIPFPDASFEVVYHSHVLEHFPRSKAARFVTECVRVLKPGGILRVVVPDLDQIVRLYVEARERAAAGDPTWEENYDWMMLELFDQTVREASGGEMGKYLGDETIGNEAFVIERVGREAREAVLANVRRAQRPPRRRSLLAEVKKLCSPSVAARSLREFLLRHLLGSEYRMLQVGRFRAQGEVHQWMYDHHSLSRLLKKAGLTEIVRRSAGASHVPNWRAYNLDTNADGSTYKTDSLFVEARKPGT